MLGGHGWCPVLFDSHGGYPTCPTLGRTSVVSLCSPLICKGCCSQTAGTVAVWCVVTHESRRERGGIYSSLGSSFLLFFLKK